MWPLIAVVAAASAGLWYSVRKKPARDGNGDEVAACIEAFLGGSGGENDWDDFVSCALADPFLEAIRQRCLTLPADFPSDAKGRYCGEEGLAMLRRLAARARDYERRRSA